MNAIPLTVLLLLTWSGAPAAAPGLPEPSPARTAPLAAQLRMPVGDGVATRRAAARDATDNRYVRRNFVANDATAYRPEIATDPAFIDAWGIATRPAGIPGHFWVVAGNKSFQYVGDVTGKRTPPCSAVTALCADLAPLPSNAITFPDFPLLADGKPDLIGNHGTGVVFNANKDSFVITQKPSAPSVDLSPITAGAKFLFATNYGAIYAWTERKRPDGTFDRADEAVKVFDARETGDGGQFYGLATSPNSDRLYVADFGRRFSIRIFDKTLVDGQLREITARLKGFANPFLRGRTRVRANDLVPWNVQVFGNRVFVAYARVLQQPKAPKGTPWAANEVHATGAGRLVEFDLDGKLIAVWEDRGLLDAPWGLAMAPAGFGALSDTLLVGNFGDYDGSNKGSIVAFDMKDRKAIGYMRKPDGTPLLVAGIWGLTFGNGDTLGDADALYFAAGPKDEKDGLFGAIRHAPPPSIH